MKPIKLLLVAILVVGFSALAISNLVSHNNKLKLRNIQLESTSTQLKKLELERKDLNKQLENEVNQKEINEQKVQELEQKSIEQDQKQKELEAQLQAKLDAKKQQQQVFSSTAFAAAKPTGTKAEWLAASGIPEQDWWAVDYIVSRESGWNPCAYYPGKSDCSLTADQVNATGYGTACGLGMSLPCGKWGANWTDPVSQLQSMHGYVDKYGGWAGAVQYWKNNHHY